MRIDLKIQTWRSFDIDENKLSLEKAIELIKKNPDLLYEEDGFISSDFCFEGEEFVLQKGNEVTVEIFNNNDELIWDNRC